ncbi:MAG TPA: flagellar hook-length control protein FliK [Steroidobacteraceae bacterium]|nr:flagellar hook-length control protein FliK [Steroidobacteraceae bacterium]
MLADASSPGVDGAGADFPGLLARATTAGAQGANDGASADESPSAGTSKSPHAPNPADDPTTWLAQVMGLATAAQPALGGATASALDSAPGPAASHSGSPDAAANAVAGSTARGRALEALLSQAPAPPSLGTPPPGSSPAGGGTSGTGPPAPPTTPTADAVAASGALSDTATSDAAAQGSAPSAASAAANAANATPDAAQSAVAASHLSHAAPASAQLSAVQAALRAPLGTAEWVDELGGQLTWMASHGIGSASLQVSPPGLGPIEARISVHGGEASVWFGAAQPDTRAALEQALPRLRELFGAQGLALGDAGVFREPPRQQHEPAAASVAGSSAPQRLTESTPSASGVVQGVGLLDLYA